MDKKEIKKYRNFTVEHPMTVEIVELPGLSLSEGTFDGFGKRLSASISDLAEKFEEEETEETE